MTVSEESLELEDSKSVSNWLLSLNLLKNILVLPLPNSLFLFPNNDVSDEVNGGLSWVSGLIVTVESLDPSSSREV